MGPDGAPRRPKIASRRIQDRLGSVFFTLDFYHRFLIVLGSILGPFWPPKWVPRGECKLGLGPLGPIQDGPKIVWVRSFFRLVVRDRFFGRLGVVLGSFLAAPGVVLVLFRHLNSSIHPVNSSTRRCNSSTHQLINSSTHCPSALSYPARRTARCAIKSAATRRVGACPNGFRNLLRILVRILRTQRV